MESKKLEFFSFSEKSLLWIHGGHPFLPCSSDVHDQQYQLLKFVETIWPRKIGSIYQGIHYSEFFFVVHFWENFEHTILGQDISSCGTLTSYPLKWLMNLVAGCKLPLFENL